MTVFHSFYYAARKHARAHTEAHMHSHIFPTYTRTRTNSRSNNSSANHRRGTMASVKLYCLQAPSCLLLDTARDSRQVVTDTHHCASVLVFNHPPPPKKKKKKLFGREYIPRSSLRTHANHRTYSKDPDIHILSG